MYNKVQNAVFERHCLNDRLPKSDCQGSVDLKLEFYIYTRVALISTVVCKLQNPRK